MNNQQLKKKAPITKGQMGAMLGVLHNNQSQLNKAAGAALGVEIRMKWIAELCESVRNELAENYKKDKRKATSPYYWKCSLKSLGEAIAKVFSDKLELDESQNMLSINDLRNKLLHVAFADLMQLLGIEPVGRQVYPKKLLKPQDIQESLLSMQKSKILREFEKRATEAIDILEKIQWSLVGVNKFEYFTFPRCLSK